MSRPRKVDYFESEREYPGNQGAILVELYASWVPLMLSSLETRKGRSFWKEGDWEAGFNLVCQAQERLLTDMTEPIIRNIWAARGIDPAQPYDPDNPVPLPLAEGSTLTDLYARVGLFRQQSVQLSTESRDLLIEIRDSLAAQGAGGEEVVNLLTAILAAL